MPKFRRREIVEAHRNTDPNAYLTISDPNNSSESRRITDYWIVKRSGNGVMFYESDIFNAKFEPVEEDDA